MTLLPFGGGDPDRGPLVVDMIGPPSGDENGDVQEVLHGKSASRSRTSSVVSGGSFSSAAKIIAPVCGHRIRPGGLEDGVIGILARRHKYSETLMPSRWRGIGSRGLRHG